MNILMTGGTGLIGSAFIKKFQSQYSFTLLTRQQSKAKANMQSVVTTTLDKLKSLDQFDAVINLQGEPIFGKRWSIKQKKMIQESRWHVTQTLAALINKAASPPKVFISGSAIGYYGRQTALDINENSALSFPEFSHQLCKKWEKSALKAQDNTRVCLLRTGIVLSTKGGALAQMLPSFKFGLGSTIGSGEQFMSWIHIDDMVEAINFILRQESLSGPINLTAPSPASNQEFSDCLAKALARPRWLNMPAQIMQLLFGEAADLLIHGQHVVPEKLLNDGFIFHYPELKPALTHLLPYC